MNRIAFSSFLAAALTVGGCVMKDTAPSEKTASAPAIAPTPATAPSAIPTAPSAPVKPATPNDYGSQANWLCLPGAKGACDTDENTTIVEASGATHIEKFKPAQNPSVDCFYVYPTVSLEPSVVSDMKAGPEEVGVVAQQFARFGSVCRTFAPLYRQFTLTALAARMQGKPMSNVGIDPKLNYNDVLDAWNYYLAHYNNGRPFVLIAHSQGSGILIQLIKNEIDGRSIEKRMLSAMLMGSRVQVPVGKNIGGDFQATPLCHSRSELGCVIAYASFRADVPPPPNTLFGKGNAPGLEAACVNPAALGGGSGAAHAYMSRGGSFNGVDYSTEWVKGRAVNTPFVSVPGLISAACEKNDVGTYLAITLHGDPKSPRTTDIKGDVVIMGQRQPNWGLHLIDANLFMGNLLDIVRSETKAYAKHPAIAGRQSENPV